MREAETRGKIFDGEFPGLLVRFPPYFIRSLWRGQTGGGICGNRIPVYNQYTTLCILADTLSPILNNRRLPNIPEYYSFLDLAYLKFVSRTTNMLFSHSRVHLNPGRLD